MTKRAEERTPLLAADAGVNYVRASSGDPIADWIALTEAVEALCPRWPHREPMSGGEFRT